MSVIVNSDSTVTSKQTIQTDILTQRTQSKAKHIHLIILNEFRRINNRHTLQTDHTYQINLMVNCPLAQPLTPLRRGRNHRIHMRPLLA